MSSEPPLTTPEAWGARYREDQTPWDLGAPHPELEARLERDLLGRRRFGHGARAVVPGCGRGWDAFALAEAGWIVTALDFAAEVEEPVRQLLEPLGGHFQRCNALDYAAQPAFELLFEHTFFCALDPSLRPEYGVMARRLVGYRGLLAALVFPADKPIEEGGPPYRTTVPALEEALGDGFRLTAHEVVARPLERRAWKEEWAVFQRLDTED